MGRLPGQTALVPNAQLEPWRYDHWPAELPSDSRSVVLGDVDGDGDLDAFVGRGVVFEERAVSALFLGDGQGGFERAPAGSMPRIVGAGASVDAADVDGDGDLDLVLGDAASQPRLLRNVGAGRFVDDTAVAMPASVAGVRMVALADYDRDGDPDLLVAFDGLAAELWRNDGRGRFARVAGALPTKAWPVGAAKWVDVDRDGDLDIVVGVVDGQDRLWVQFAAGRWRDETSARFPSDARSTHGMVARDFDADGDVDLALTGIGEPVRIWRNDGRARFSVAPAGSMPSGRRFAGALADLDFDGDGDVDLVVGGDRRTPSAWWRNDGSGRFVALANDAAPIALGSVGAFAVGDLDGDADPDLVVATRSLEADRVVLGDGRGRFAAAWHSVVEGEVGNVRAVASGDFDRDGAVDLVIARFGDVPAIAWSRGRSGLAVSTRGLPSSRLWAKDVAVEDFNGDRLLDVAFATWFGGTVLWLGDGRGGFRDASAGIPSFRGRAEAIVAVDVDRDGDVDLVVGHEQGQLPKLYRNQGPATFVDHSLLDLPQQALPVLDLVAADVDRDGDADLLVATARGAPTVLWRNDGQGRFTDAAASMPVDTPSHPAVVPLDFDRDGDIDFALGGAAAPMRLLENDGHGRFRYAAANRTPSGRVSTTALAAGDIDGDGDPDLIGGTAAGSVDHVYRNDGGRFVIAGSLGVGVPWSEALALVDLDVDGDPDLIAAAPGLVRGFRNRMQDLDVRRLPRIGRAVEVELFARPTGALSGDAILWAGIPMSSGIPTNLGVLRLQPGLAVPVAATGLPAGSGRGTATLSLPADPALVGQRLGLQAIVRVPGRSRIALTNGRTLTVSGM